MVNIAGSTTKPLVWVSSLSSIRKGTAELVWRLRLCLCTAAYGPPAQGYPATGKPAAAPPAGPTV